MLLPNFQGLTQKKKGGKRENKKKYWKKTKKHILLRRGYCKARKIVKDWLRRIKNINIEI